MATPRKQKNGRHVDGREILDPTPLAAAVAFRAPPTLAQQIARAVRHSEIQKELARAGVETFEESEDFDVGDDFDPRTPFEEEYEGQFEVEASLEAKHFEGKGTERRKRAPKPPRQPAPDSESGPRSEPGYPPQGGGKAAGLVDPIMEPVIKKPDSSGQK